MRFCHNCGSQVSQTAKFCTQCGTQLTLPEPVAQPEPAVQEQTQVLQQPIVDQQPTTVFEPVEDAPTEVVEPVADTASETAAPGDNAVASETDIVENDSASSEGAVSVNTQNAGTAQESVLNQEPLSAQDDQPTAVQEPVIAQDDQQTSVYQIGDVEQPQSVESPAEADVPTDTQSVSEQPFAPEQLVEPVHDVPQFGQAQFGQVQPETVAQPEAYTQTAPYAQTDVYTQPDTYAQSNVYDQPVADQQFTSDQQFTTDQYATAQAVPTASQAVSPLANQTEPSSSQAVPSVAAPADPAISYAAPSDAASMTPSAQPTAPSAPSVTAAIPQQVAQQAQQAQAVIAQSVKEPKKHPKVIAALIAAVVAVIAVLAWVFVLPHANPNGQYVFTDPEDSSESLIIHIQKKHMLMSISDATIEADLGKPKVEKKTAYYPLSNIVYNDGDTKKTGMEALEYLPLIPSLPEKLVNTATVELVIPANPQNGSFIGEWGFRMSAMGVYATATVKATSDGRLHAAIESPAAKALGWGSRLPSADGIWADQGDSVMLKLGSTNLTYSFAK